MDVDCLECSHPLSNLGYGIHTCPQCLTRMSVSNTGVRLVILNKLTKGESKHKPSLVKHIHPIGPMDLGSRCGICGDGVGFSGTPARWAGGFYKIKRETIGYTVLPPTYDVEEVTSTYTITVPRVTKGLVCSDCLGLQGVERIVEHQPKVNDYTMWNE